MLKVRLLNDGGYGDMENVKFPVIVDGADYHGVGCNVLGANLVKVGASNEHDVWDIDYEYLFLYGTECEVIDEE